MEKETNNDKPHLSLGLTDMKGEPLNQDDVIFNGVDYYRIYIKKEPKSPADKPEIEAISCTNGYLHNIDQNVLGNFVRIGPFEKHRDLFECD